MQGNLVTRTDLAARLRCWAASVAWVTACLCVACSEPAHQSEVTDEPPAGLDWTDGTPSFLTGVAEIEPYTGDDPTVLEAQERLPTGAALHSEVVLRSCGPLGGVCHNRKEYPDMRTPANFLNLINAPCNVQPGTRQGVFDRCERPGDRFTLGNSGDKEIGWVEVVPESDSAGEGPDRPGLHLHLADPLSDEYHDEENVGRFVRTFELDGKVQDLKYAAYETRWYVYDEGRHIVGEVSDNRVDEVTAIMQVGIEQGDLNRNGVYGARPDETGNPRGPIALIEPGDPETSYLVGRMRGTMAGERVPGSRMPLANPPFSVAEMVALFCYIEGLPPDGVWNLASPIDYENCSYSDPATHDALRVEGGGTGWSDRISPLLSSNCGGCHSAERDEGDLILDGPDVYESIVGQPAPGDPMGRPLVAPGDPFGSYLYLKLIDDDSIIGSGMPLDPIAGVRTLSEEELADIEAWITDGAAP